MNQNMQDDLINLDDALVQTTFAIDTRTNVLYNRCN